jgi:DNA polymerase elongation subunit (family B)
MPRAPKTAKDRERDRQRKAAEMARERIDAEAAERSKKNERARHMKFLASMAKRPMAAAPPIVTFDLESKDGDSDRPGFDRPFLTGLFDGESLFQWRNAPGVSAEPWETRALADGGCVDRMMRALLSEEYRGRRMYAHNGGSFDFLSCIAWLKLHVEEYDLHHFATQGPALLSFHVSPAGEANKVKRRKGAKRPRDWIFVDSLRMLPMSLKEAARAFGCETQKGEMNLATPEDDSSWEVYHAADMRSLYEAIVKVRGLLEGFGGEIMMTAPSAALRLLQRRYLKEKIWRNKHFVGCKDETCKGCAHAFVRKAYKGGRVEMFTREGKNLHYYDINSSYPAAMLEHMPVGPMIHTRPVRRDFGFYQTQWHEHKLVAFVDATVFIPHDCPVPPLPLHHPDSGKLVFPVGRFRGVWDAVELELVEVVGGRVEELHEMLTYPASPVLADMMEALYAMRDKSKPTYDEGMAKLAKLICNSLYGKFGQRPERTEVLFPKNGIAPEGAVPAGGDPFEATLWYMQTEEDAAHIIPQIAAHVTSLARVRLWHAMWIITQRGGHLYYCDTDSVVTDITLPESNDLGKLKAEFPCQHLHGVFVRPKVYMLSCECEDKQACLWRKEVQSESGEKKWKHIDEKLVAKGVPKSDPKGIVLDKAAWLRFTGGGRIDFQRLAKLRTMAREGLRAPWMVKTHKTIKGEYDKRVLLLDGTTRAIVFDEPLAKDVAAE